MGYPSNKKIHLGNLPMDRPFKPPIAADLQVSLFGRGFRHAGAEGVISGFYDQEVIACHPQGVINGSFVYRMDEGKNKFLAVRHLGAENNLPALCCCQF